MRVTIIGIGGIGGNLAEWVAQFLAYHPTARQSVLTLIDGDAYEEHNRARQRFEQAGNKARSKAETLRRWYPALRIEAVAEYCTPRTVEWMVPESEIVLLAVDNHATRKLVSDAAGRRRSICVISGGNEDTIATMHAYVRRRGRDRTPPLTVGHPEIAFPTDRRPEELGCEERAAAGEPQIYVANLAAALLIMCAFWRYATDPEGFCSRLVGNGAVREQTAYDEAVMDILRLRATSERRAVGEPPAAGRGDEPWQGRRQRRSRNRERRECA